LLLPLAQVPADPLEATGVATGAGGDEPAPVTVISLKTIVPAVLQLSVPEGHAGPSNHCMSVESQKLRTTVMPAARGAVMS
jgi:hypothetical protein